MLRRILVPLDPSPFSKAAIGFAIARAVRHGAEITGLAVLDAPEIEKAVGPVTPGAVEYARKAERRREAAAHARIQDLLADFDKVCSAADVRHTRLEVQGNPAEMIIRESVFYDLVVMGMKTYYHYATSDEPCSTLTEIAGRLMPPTITVPEGGLDESSTNRILIAYGGSRTAAKSIRQFVALGLFQDADITVLCSNEDMDLANQLTGSVERYLSAHGYSNIEQVWTPGPVVDALRDEHLANTDVVVIGAHAKHGILSFLYGGVTKFLLADGSRPLFIAN